jgi:hypothetical protein
MTAPESNFFQPLAFPADSIDATERTRSAGIARAMPVAKEQYKQTFQSGQFTGLPRNVKTRRQPITFGEVVCTLKLGARYADDNDSHRSCELSTDRQIPEKEDAHRRNGSFSAKISSSSDTARTDERRILVR